eukprot:COSAG01_NODE_2744_length_7150_cov_5.435116_2_plen_304_part_00
MMLLSTPHPAAPAPGRSPAVLNSPPPITMMLLLSLCSAATAATVAVTRGDKPPPPPPAGIHFFAGFSDHAVLQRGPGRAALYGKLEAGATGATVQISPGPADLTGGTVAAAARAYEVAAQVSGDGTWKALLPPHPAGGVWSVTAKCQGCASEPRSATLHNLTYGDVVYCGGQSNMWLPLLHTLTRNDTLAALRRGKYANIRLMAGDSQDGLTFPWKTAAAAATDGSCTDITHGGNVAGCSLFRFSAACYYYAEALTDSAPPVTGPISRLCRLFLSRNFETKLRDSNALLQGLSGPGRSHRLWG